MKMSIGRIAHITPALPPAVNGLGDFSVILAESLAREGWDDFLFLVRHGQRHDGAAVDSFGPGTLFKTLQHHNVDVIILHYVGYAYDRHGVPLYLARALKRYQHWRRCKIVVFFHELYAPAVSLLEMSFYTSNLQKMIVKNLFALADAVFTNCAYYEDTLRRLVGGTVERGIATGVFSNVPESGYDPQQTKDDGSMVVFGSYHRRKAVFENPRLRIVLQRLHIRRLYDVGPGVTTFRQSGIEVITFGALPVADIAPILNSAGYGALIYKPHLLGKSGIFAAYAAFGVIPINLTSSDYPLYDDLAPGVNYFSWSTVTKWGIPDPAISRPALRDWYRFRDRTAIANRVVTALVASVEPPHLRNSPVGPLERSAI